MTPQELKQQVMEDFWKTVREVNVEDIRSETIKLVSDENVDSLIDRTVQMTEERIVGLLNKTKLPTNSTNGWMTTLMYIPNEPINREINERIDWVISLITNKSGINK